MTGRYEKIIRFGKSSLAKLIYSLRRFPETLLICVATVTVLIILNHGGMDSGGGPFVTLDSGEFLTRLAAALALGVPLSLCLKLIFERGAFSKIASRVLVYIAAAGGLVLYYFYLLQDFEMVSLSRYGAVTLALYLAFTFIPYFYRRQNYELYVIKLFISFLITYLFATVLFGGISAILATISYLFSAPISSNIYFDIWLIAGGIFAPAFFLAGIPRSDEDIQAESYPKVIAILLSYIVMPLILAYSAILYIYFIKILVTQQWPDLMVSHLVLWYALISTLVLFAIYPRRSENRWNEAFVAHFPKVILPLLAMMFAAMGIRISAYGITENRYFVLLAGLWVTGAMLYLILSKKPRHIFLPASLALVAVLSVFGPWSSYSLSVRSQNRHFEKIATEHNLLQEGQIAVAAGTTVPEAAQGELSSIILYFDQSHDLALLRALPENFEIDRMEALFGFPLRQYDFPEDEEIYFRHALDYTKMYWDISGYDYFVQLSSEEQSYRTGELELAYFPEEQKLIIMQRGETIYSQDLTAIAEEIHRENAGEEYVVSKEKMTHTESTKDLELCYTFSTIGGWEKRSADEINIDYLELYLFVGLKGAEPQ